MKYRQLDEDGDYLLGRSAPFLVDSPEVVVQAIKTRLRLMTDEWFLDLDAGTNYSGNIFGYGTQGVRDLEVQQRILNTQGVRSLISYTSEVTADRQFLVTATIDTTYGSLTITI